MAIAIVGNTPTTAATTTSHTPVVPDGSAGDLLVWCVSWGVDYAGTAYPTAADRPTLSDGVSASVTHVHTVVGGVDSPAEAYGEDTGKRCASLFTAVATSATGATDAIKLTTNGSTGATMASVCIRLSSAVGKVIETAATGGGDSNKADGWAAVGLTDIGAAAGDKLIGFIATVPAATNQGMNFTWPGCTLGTISTVISGQYTGGYNVRQNIRAIDVTAGASTGAPSYTSATTGGAGAAIVARFREVNPPAAVMNAGPDQTNVEPYTTVTLNSSGSTGSTTRTWSQTAGPAVTLTSTSDVSPTFTAPGTLNGTSLTFRVTDSGGSFDDVTIGVLPSSRRVKIGGIIVPTRRMIQVTQEQVLVGYDMNNLATGAMDVSKLRLIFGDPTLGYNSDADNLSIVNDGTRNVMRMNVDALWDGTGRIAYQPFLSESMDDGYIEYYVRFNTNFEYGQGGKFLGLGGHRDNGSMPSGGTHSTLGFSARAHWGPQNSRDDRWHTYHYLPHESTNWGTTEHPNTPSSGSAVQLGATGTYPDQFGAGEIHKIKYRIKHNTVITEGDLNPPNDGLLEMWQDDIKIKSVTKTFRLYQAANTRRIALSIFRGGSDNTWNVTSNGTIDFWGIRVVKLT